MGRVSTKIIKNASKQLVEKHYQSLTLDFYQNRDVLEKVSVIQGKKLRNKIAGYATRLVKRIKYGRVKGVSIKAQEEEERKKVEAFTPSESILDVEKIVVDSVTLAMIKEAGITGSFFSPSTESK